MQKISYFIIAVLLCGVLQVHAQSSDIQNNRLSLGIIGGLNFADMHFPNHQGDEDQEITMRNGFGAGVVLDIRLSKNIFIRLEPMYLQKGCNIEEGSDPANQPEGQITSSAIEIPLLIQYTLGDKIQPYLIGGPTVGYNLNSEIEFDVTGLKFKGDTKDVTNTFDMGFTFGGGVQVNAGFGTIFLEGRYTYGLLNQRKSGTVTASSNGFQFDLPSDKEEDKYVNRGFQLLTGIIFSLQ